LLVYLGLKYSPEFDELLLSEFPKPCGEETKPYHLNDLCRRRQAQVLPCYVIFLRILGIIKSLIRRPKSKISILTCLSALTENVTLLVIV